MAGTYWQVMACKARNAKACFMPCNAMVYAASRACTRSPIHFVLHDAYLVFRRRTFFFGRNHILTVSNLVLCVFLKKAVAKRWPSAHETLAPARGLSFLGRF